MFTGSGGVADVPAPLALNWNVQTTGPLGPPLMGSCNPELRASLQHPLQSANGIRPKMAIRQSAKWQSTKWQTGTRQSGENLPRNFVSCSGSPLKAY